MTTQQLTLEQAQAKGLTSLDIAAEKRAQLKALLPEAFAGDTLDLDQLRRALGDFMEASKERYGLNWPGRADCMKVIQAPSIATLRPCREESVNFDTTENLFIEGDNLEVLKLLQKAYFGKVKMIYLDPPYNTTNDFVYEDDFTDSLRKYRQQTQQLDEAGNLWSTESEGKEQKAGRRHARWLNMMYPRLYLARNLLREDGVIFISIDDNEQARTYAAGVSGVTRVRGLFNAWVM
jgi:adenine-specific DNA-methyltransferase